MQNIKSCIEHGVGKDDIEKSDVTNFFYLCIDTNIWSIAIVPCILNSFSTLSKAFSYAEWFHSDFGNLFLLLFYVFVRFIFFTSRTLKFHYQFLILIANISIGKNDITMPMHV